MPRRVAPDRLAWGALALAMVGAAILIYHLTRDTTLWFDDWNYALYRRGGGLHSLLAPYNEHLSVVPIVIYKLLFATEGIATYTGYRIVVIVGHLLCAGLVFAYARRRVGDYLGLLAALLILFLGPAWQNILWPFQIAWLISVGAGIGALLLLDRRDRVGDAGACLLLLISLGSSSVGVAVLLGVIADLIASRRPRTDAWIAGVPLVLYVAWSIAYQHSSVVASNLYVAWRFVASSAAAAFSVPLGLSGQSVSDQTGTILEFGVPLLVAAGLALVWRSHRGGLWSARAIGLAVILLAFWIFTAVGRGNISSPYASRYLYVDSVFVLLLAAELFRGRRAGFTTAVGLAVVTAAAVVSNVGILRDAGSYLRSQAPIARADLAAFDITRGIVPTNYVASAFPGYPFLLISAGNYFAMRRSIGSPAFTPAQLLTTSEPAREVADTELARIHGVSLAAGGSALLAPRPPVPEQASGGSLDRRGSCDRFLPTAFAPSGSVAMAEVELPPSGLQLVTSTDPVSVGIRRFAAGFHPLGSLAAQSTATLRVAPDAARQPWQVQITGTAPVTICGLSP